MVWPDYIGLDPEPARSLAITTSHWSGSIDSALRSIQAAEALTGEPVGVQLPLDDLGNTGRLMGSAISRALDTVESYRVPTIGTYWHNQLQGGSAVQVYGQAAATRVDTRWTAAAQDGLVPGGPDSRVELPTIDMSDANAAIAQLAAEVERLNGTVEAGVTDAAVTQRRDEAFAELKSLGRTVTIDEASDFGIGAGTWVDREVASTAVEWEVPYEEAALLHRRGAILAEPPTISGHLELVAIASALGALHQPVVEPDVGTPPDLSPDRLSVGVFDGLVAERPESLDDPASLSNESLVRAIENWDAGLVGEAAPVLGALVAERNARAGAGGSNAIESAVLTNRFIREALEQRPQLDPDDIIGHQLFQLLVEEGLSTYYASELAAVLRESFGGNQVATYRGLVEAFTHGPTQLAQQGQLPSAAGFENLAEELGARAVADLILNRFRSASSGVELYADLAGERVDPHLLLAVTDYAVNHGVPVTGVARELFGLDPANPPPMATATDLTAPEIVEIHMIIEQEIAVLEALQGHPKLLAMLDSAHWLSQRHRFDGNPSADAFSAAVSGDLDELFAERDAVDAFVRGAIGTAPGEDVIQAQLKFIEELKVGQFFVSLAGTDHFDPLDTDQVQRLEALHRHWPELYRYFNPAPIEYEDVRDPFQIHQDHEAGWLRRVAVEEIDWLLANHNRGTEPLISTGLASALQAVMKDPQLVEALTPHRQDLHADPLQIGMIDFHRLDRAAAIDLFANITEPWAGDIDTIKPGQVPDDSRVRSDWDIWTERAETNPEIPRLVVDTAREIMASGLYDTSPLEALHITLSIASILLAPGYRAMAALVDAGVYLSVDKDVESSLVSLTGAALAGGAGLKQLSTDAAEAFVGAAGLGLSINALAAPASEIEIPLTARSEGESASITGADE